MLNRIVVKNQNFPLKKKQQQQQVLQWDRKRLMNEHKFKTAGDVLLQASWF